MFDIGSMRRMAVPGQSGSGSPSLLPASRLQGPHAHGATQGLKHPALSPGGSSAHPATQNSSPGNRIHKLKERTTAQPAPPAVRTLRDTGPAALTHW
ncbi:hypothetical protein CRUP_023501 [Coryphaenoides rupestris]|nr:hypothetical protein CRUP_023501 [Coryphaenoides rupestris]